MTLRSSDLQSDSDLDSIRNSCDVFGTPCSFRVDNICQNFHHQNFVAELYRLTEGSERRVQAGNSFPWLHKYRGQETGKAFSFIPIIVFVFINYLDK